MRSLKDNSGLTPVLINADYPNGAIINETLSIDGTAVINQIYNDLLVNIYKILETVGMSTSGIADNESTTYQVLAALQKLTNVLNDLEQPLTKASTTFSIPIAIDLLPDNYVMICKVAGAAVAGTTYSFKGTGALTYDFVSPNGFNDGDELLLVLNQTTVKAYSFGGGVPASGYAEFNAGDLLGADTFFFLPLTGSGIPQFPKYLTMYIQNGDGDNQNKMIAPAYVADTQIIQGMPSPVDFPTVAIKLYYA